MSAGTLLMQPSTSREKDPRLENMQKDLMEAKKQEKTHRKLLLRIQKEKKQLEQQNQTLRQEVEKMQTTNSKTAVGYSHSLCVCVRARMHFSSVVLLYLSLNNIICCNLLYAYCLLY